MRVYGDTHTGMARPDNQDCYFCAVAQGGTPAFAAVCDGMGGVNGGQVASTLALAVIEQRLMRELHRKTHGSSVLPIFESALAAANRQVYERAEADIELTGMGTTAVLAAVLGDTLYLAHAGDSRAYSFFAGGELVQRTADHTVVQVLLSRGEITPEQAAEHPQRNYITRAIGAEADIQPELDEIKLEPGECVLLCSDGLYNFVGAQELPGLLARCIAQGNVAPLIDSANENGGGDNITAVIFDRTGAGE